jgi:hypothetical protein
LMVWLCGGASACGSVAHVAWQLGCAAEGEESGTAHMF